VIPPNTAGKPSRKRSALVTTGRSLLGGAAALGVLVILVTVTPLDVLLARELAGRWDDPKGDILIVLGGGMVRPGILDGSSYLRSVYAVEAYKSGHFRTIVVSGGGNPAVAPAMADFLKCHGVPENAVLIEDRSINTIENAEYVRDALASTEGMKVLLTSDFHMLRAHRAFEKAGMHVLTRPVPDAIKRGMNWRSRWPAFLDVADEFAKIAYYRMRDWI